MKMFSDDSRIFLPSFITVVYGPYNMGLMIWPMVNIGENILESSVTEFMNLPPCVFDVDYVAQIRSGLSITVLEKKTPRNYRLKK